MQSIQISHFSDVLCVWAYVGQASLDRLQYDLGGQISVTQRYCSVFPDVWGKIDKQWDTRGGFDGYGDHVKSIVAGFEGLKLHPDTWFKTRPRSSASPHLFIKAVELIEQQQGVPAGFPDSLPTHAARSLRVAFFERGEDVCHWDVQRQVAAEIGIGFDEVLKRIETGEAIAQLSADYETAQAMGIAGSPTYVLDGGRQKLFGNISYGVIEANVKGLLAGEGGEAASLCS
ncbi:hypothetical protein DL239_06015 [Sedimentitalea sp. CY04]|uniref:DSBA-like thioredoxin domain-containing protein n=1 Tax=Parasedimentitalea denitrificans TaxID=2211118 RepID=A0ABX0W6W3_9RHOB|nr:DsbA family protein [Sedimentitalea sp. CY04]NIZ60529.1 hypothetical protein [Sedimentitalea sp. CY04]